MQVRKLNCKLQKLQDLLQVSLAERMSVVRHIALLKENSENKVQAIKKRNYQSKQVGFINLI